MRYFSWFCTWQTLLVFTMVCRYVGYGAKGKQQKLVALETKLQVRITNACMD